MGFLNDILGFVADIAPALTPILPIAPLIGGIAGALRSDPKPPAAPPAPGGQAAFLGAVPPIVGLGAGAIASTVAGVGVSAAVAGIPGRSLSIPVRPEGGRMATRFMQEPTSTFLQALAFPLFSSFVTEAGTPMSSGMALDSFGALGFTGGNGRQSTRTIIQTIDLASGRTMKMDIKSGRPWLMNKEVNTLVKVTKAVRRADRKIPRKAVKESRMKALTRDVTEKALERAACPCPPG